MARISLIAPESASPEVREISDTTLRGKPGNVQKALAHRPEMQHNTTWHRRSAQGSLPKIGQCSKQETTRAMERKSRPCWLMSRS